MTRAVFMFLVSGSVFCFAGVHAGPGNQGMTNAQRSPLVVQYHADHHRNPFAPQSVVPDPAGSSLEAPDVDRQTVKVLGTMLSVQGRSALLEFEGGERLIVVPGQVISAYSRVVTRITEDGVTLSVTGDKVGTQAERTYRFYGERDHGEPRARGISERPEE